ncbi:MAG TPA: hypothetical protein VGC06_32605 [Actinomycetes bacterium]
MSALAMVIGWEALIVLGDVRGLDQDGQRATMGWAARTLVEAMLAESAALEIGRCDVVKRGV